MNNMLKLTNNNIKNMEIDKTIGIAIDNNFMCAYSIALSIIGAVLIIATIIGAISSFGTLTPLAAWLFYGEVNAFGLGLAGVAVSCK